MSALIHLELGKIMTNAIKTFIKISGISYEALFSFWHVHFPNYTLLRLMLAEACIT